MRTYDFAAFALSLCIGLSGATSSSAQETGDEPRRKGLFGLGILKSRKKQESDKPAPSGHYDPYAVSPELLEGLNATTQSSEGGIFGGKKEGEKSDPKSPPDSYGTVSIGRPVVFSRERLLSELIGEQIYLRGQLDDMPDSIRMGGRIDTRLYNSISRSFGASFDPIGGAVQDAASDRDLQRIGRSNEAEDALLQTELQRLALDRQINALNAQLIQEQQKQLIANAVKEENPTPLTLSPTNATPFTALPEVTAAQDGDTVFTRLEKSIADLRTQVLALNATATGLRARVDSEKLGLKSNAEISSIDERKDLISYRQFILGEIRKRMLDDSHDTDGKVLTHATFPVTLQPPSDAKDLLLDLSFEIEEDNTEDLVEGFKKQLARALRKRIHHEWRDLTMRLNFESPGVTRDRRYLEDAFLSQLKFDGDQLVENLESQKDEKTEEAEKLRQEQGMAASDFKKEAELAATVRQVEELRVDILALEQLGDPAYYSQGSFADTDESVPDNVVRVAEELRRVLPDVESCADCNDIVAALDLELEKESGVVRDLVGRPSGELSKGEERALENALAAGREIQFAKSELQSLSPEDYHQTLPWYLLSAELMPAGTKKEQVSSEEMKQRITWFRLQQRFGDLAKMLGYELERIDDRGRVALSEKGTGQSDLSDELLKEVRNPEISIFSQAPSEVSQNISRISAQENLANLTLAVTAQLQKGADLTYASDRTRQSEQNLQSIIRKPLAVAFSEQGKGSFGWYLGPEFKLEEKKVVIRRAILPKNRTTGTRTEVGFSHRLTRHELSVAFLRPGWVENLKLTPKINWIDPKSGERWTTEGDELDEVEISVGANLDPFIDAYLERTLGESREPFIVPTKRGWEMVHGQTSQRLFIRGHDLWRSPEVYIDSYKAKSVSVAPDLLGIYATFDTVIADTPGNYRGLRVVTATGEDFIPGAVRIVGAASSPKTDYGQPTGIIPPKPTGPLPDTVKAFVAKLRKTGPGTISQDTVDVAWKYDQPKGSGINVVLSDKPPTAPKGIDLTMTAELRPPGYPEKEAEKLAVPMTVALGDKTVRVTPAKKLDGNRGFDTYSTKPGVLLGELALYYTVTAAPAKPERIPIEVAGGPLRVHNLAAFPDAVALTAASLVVKNPEKAQDITVALPGSDLTAWLDAKYPQLLRSGDDQTVRLIVRKGGVDLPGAGIPPLGQIRDGSGGQRFLTFQAKIGTLGLADLGEGETAKLTFAIKTSGDEVPAVFVPVKGELVVSRPAKKEAS